MVGFPGGISGAHGRRRDAALRRARRARGIDLRALPDDAPDLARALVRSRAPDPALVAAFLVALRRARGWSLAGAARRLGVHEATVARWEAGDTPPTSRRARARALRFAHETLTGGPTMYRTPTHPLPPRVLAAVERLQEALGTVPDPNTPIDWRSFAAAILRIDLDAFTEGRHARRVAARQALAYVMRQRGYTLAEIGEATGRHHATAGYHVARFGGAV